LEVIAKFETVAGAEDNGAAVLHQQYVHRTRLGEVLVGGRATKKKTQGEFGVTATSCCRLW